jgi:O-antigen/teichoic acid export membrane protein
MFPSLIFELIAPLKPFYPPCGINYPVLTLTHEEGMTFTAYLYLNYLFGSTGGKGITTGTDHLSIVIIFGMNLILHFSICLVDTYLPFVLASRFKLDHTVNQGKEGIVLT